MHDLIKEARILDSYMVYGVEFKLKGTKRIKKIAAIFKSGLPKFNLGNTGSSKEVILDAKLSLKEIKRVEIYFPTKTGIDDYVTIDDSDSLFHLQYLIFCAFVIARTNELVSYVKADVDSLERMMTPSKNSKVNFLSFSDTEFYSHPELTSNSKRLTFSQAREKHLNTLEEMGWEVKRNLKIPHATTRFGRNYLKIWFKPQSVYAAVNISSSNQAASMHSDYRDISTQDLITYVENYFDI